MTNTQNPAPTAAHPVEDRRVQPENVPASGAVEVRGDHPEIVLRLWSPYGSPKDRDDAADLIVDLLAALRLAEPALEAAVEEARRAWDCASEGAYLPPLYTAIQEATANYKAALVAIAKAEAA